MPTPEGGSLYFDNNRGTPLAVNGVLYYASPFSILVALDGQSGEELWTFDPEAWRMNFRFLGNLRGVSYWTDGEVERIYYGHFDIPFVFHRRQDRPARPGLWRGRARRFGGLTTPAAGRRGSLELRESRLSPWCAATWSPLARPWATGASGRRPSTPLPATCRPSTCAPARRCWEFHTIPLEGEYGNETWESGAWKKYGRGQCGGLR